MRPLIELADPRRVKIIQTGTDGLMFRLGPLSIIASWGFGWDHVSVSRADRCPNWSEMERAKRYCFRPNETAMQLHVPPADHVNCHPYTLHLWRPQDVDIPRPPSILV